MEIKGKVGPSVFWMKITFFHKKINEENKNKHKVYF
jgi:hypothetical protein